MDKTMKLMMKSSSWMFLFVVFTAVCSAQAYRAFYTARCDCNGRSRYCLPDSEGLHCVDCTGNTEGRHCERCKTGYYQQGAATSCTACRCNPTGSVGSSCDSRGRCSCRDGVTGDTCDRCVNGPITAEGCPQSRQTREDSGSFPLEASCFCYGHSSSCSAQTRYRIHIVSSTFSTGNDGWTVATADGVVPDDAHFRWSPSHQDVEVISKNILPVYLYAPAPFLGNQVLSYGQNLSFSLRLDRGVRRPSVSDVVLEGSGLRVSASLGDLRSIVPCGQKKNYSFRLDEEPSSRWRPQLSSFLFQTLLQNLTSIRIRATFGENGRGYLDNVKLVSARPGSPGAPARWVQTCVCPPGHEGDFCERCAAGFRRRVPADGGFSPCEPCSCRGGSCDPLTGDCFSADETPADQSCPPGTTGPSCGVCREGFYGDPAGGAGVPRPCRPCRCNGHTDASSAGSCDRLSGECLKCLNNTRGRNCETCEDGFYHRRLGDACKPCSCDLLGSDSSQCDDSGRCSCRPNFEGLKCQRSSCPACFSPIKTKMEAYALKLQQLEILLASLGGVVRPDTGDMDSALRDIEETVDDLQDDNKQLQRLEQNLQSRLSAVSRSQLEEEQEVQEVADAAEELKLKHQSYQNKVQEVKSLIDLMKKKLEEAKNDLRSADVPVGDAPLGSNLLSSLADKATDLADKHTNMASDVDRSAAAALKDSEKSLDLVRTLMNRENKVKDLLGDLKTRYDQASSRVKALENDATRKSGEARVESKMAADMLKELASLQGNIPASLKGDVDAMVDRLGALKTAVDGDVSDFQALQDGVRRDKAATEDLLSTGQNNKQKANALLDRVHVAKDDTEDALRDINTNMKELDDALNALRGFDQQIDSGKSLADAAVSRLPGINRTLQDAVRDNQETLSLLGDASGDHRRALGTVDELDKLLTGLQGALDSLPPQGNLLDRASGLHTDAEDLNTQARDTVIGTARELETARRREAGAKEAAAVASASLDEAKQTRDAVGKTLRDVTRLMDNLNQTGTVDEDRLKQLEEAVASAQKEVQQELGPRLRDMEDQENAHLRHLQGLSGDIDQILKDIANLEDILRSVPTGDCFNTGPIEEA